MARPMAAALAAAMLAALVAANLARHLPPDQWWRAGVRPAGDDIGQTLFHFSVLPRLAAALLCGSLLGLAGCVLQQVLRNPLAEPSTLGLSAGAYLALALATVFAPGLLAFGPTPLALAGGAGAVAVVLALTAREGFTPLGVVLCGLVVSLACGAVGTTIALFHEQGAAALLVWMGGALDQDGWSGVSGLLPVAALAAAASLLLLRPLEMLGLDDAFAAGRGLAPGGARLLGLAIALSASAAVVGAFGIIGFVGLAAPGLARLCGARTFRARLAAAPAVGAGLLCAADQTIQLLGAGDVPVGALTALLGAPLLIWLMARGGGSEGLPRAAAPVGRIRRPRAWLVAGLLGVVLVAAVSLSGGRGLGGFAWSMGWATGDASADLVFWRAPRMVAAMAAGAMMAGAGTLLQRLTGNEMASPEVLGVGAGATLGLTALVLLTPAPGAAMPPLAAACGALLALGAIMLATFRSGFPPHRMLITGIALGTCAQAVVALLLASGDPRMYAVLRWMAGATYLAGPTEAAVTAGTAAILLPLALCTARWLDVLALGAEAGAGLGLPLARARAALLALAAALTGVATVIAGPLSFVGLIAPQLARMAGCGRAAGQLCAAAVIGAATMGVADWLGRWLLFPNQAPAGLLASLVGAVYFLALMRRPAGRAGLSG